MARSHLKLIALIGCASVWPLMPSHADPAPQPKQQITPAQPPAADSGSAQDAGQRRRDDRKAFLDARLAALRAGLELTPEQDKLWGPVDDSIRALVSARRAMRDHAMRDHDMRDHAMDGSDGTARLKARGEHLVAVGQALEKLAGASAPFAATLSPEQKHRLPVLTRHLPRRVMRLAFGIENEWPMDRGDGDRHHGWSRDGYRSFGMDRGGMKHGGMDHEGMNRDGMDRDGMGRDEGMRGEGAWNDGERHEHHHWTRDEDSDRPGVDYDRGGPNWHRSQDDDRG